MQLPLCCVFFIFNYQMYYHFLRFISLPLWQQFSSLVALWSIWVKGSRATSTKNVNKSKKNPTQSFVYFNSVWYRFSYWFDANICLFFYGILYINTQTLQHWFDIWQSFMKIDWYECRMLKTEKPLTDRTLEWKYMHGSFLHEGINPT